MLGIVLNLSWLPQKLRWRRPSHTPPMAERYGLQCVYSASDCVADIVFIHGLMGDARYTWEADEDPQKFWPAWLQNGITKVAVWTLGYPASPTNWLGRAMALPDRATNVIAELSAKGIGQRPLIFVTHSLGGLLAKQIVRKLNDSIRKDHELIARNIRGVVFFGTPHTGSGLANFVEMFSLVSRPTQAIEDLKKDDSHLRDLNTWFRDRAAAKISTLVFCETQRCAGMISVVSLSSGDPGFPGVSPIPVDANHIRMCKFPNREDMRFRTVENFVRDCLRREPAARLENDDLSLDISVVHAPCPDFEPTALRYTVQRSPSLIVQPDSRYLRAYRQGRALELCYGEFCTNAMPELDLKLCNNTGKTIFLERVVLEVAKSTPDRSPVLLFPVGPQLRSVWIRNVGWGTVRKPVVRYSVCPENTLWPEGALAFEAPLPDFDLETELNVEEALLQMGVGIAKVKSLVTSDKWMLDNEARRRALGSLRDDICPTAHVFGEISYVATSQDGTDTAIVIKFTATTEIAVRRVGGVRISSAQYSMTLRAMGEAYSVEQDISHEIKNRETERITLRIGAPMTSCHDLELRLSYNGGHMLPSQRLQLETFVPRLA